MWTSCEKPNIVFLYFFLVELYFRLGDFPFLVETMIETNILNLSLFTSKTSLICRPYQMWLRYN